METLVFNFPFQKIDKARRIVTGVATADNVDPAGDQVQFDGSVEAFNMWVGNVREMHGKNAVGKSLGFRPVTVEHNGETYRGIEVDAYVSKGSEDTWQKVLDGTLRGFSIGGGVIEKSTEYDEKLGRKKNVISKYSLGELSLVDNPANPAAMFSMVKMADDGVLEFQEPVEKYHIFYCKTHQVAKAESSECFHCDEPMTDIGYADEFSMEVINKMVDTFVVNKGEILSTKIEKSDSTDDMEKAMGKCACGAAGPAGSKCSKCGEKISLPEDKKDGGSDDALEDSKGNLKKSVELQNNVTNGIVENTDLSPEKVSLLKGVFNSVVAFINGAEIESVESPQTEVVEKVAEIVEETDGGSEVDINELKTVLSGIVSEEIAKVKDELATSFGTQLEAITKSVSEVTEKVEAANVSVGEAVEKVSTIENSGAIKKSVDAELDDGIEVKVEKTTFWGGLFVPQAICEVLGYDS